MLVNKSGAAFSRGIDEHCNYSAGLNYLRSDADSAFKPTCGLSLDWALCGHCLRLPELAVVFQPIKESY